MAQKASKKFLDERGKKDAKIERSSSTANCMKESKETSTKRGTAKLIDKGSQGRLGLKYPSGPGKKLFS